MKNSYEKIAVVPVCDRCMHIIYENQHEVFWWRYRLHSFCADKMTEGLILLAVIVFGAIVGIGTCVGW